MRHVADEAGLALVASHHLGPAVPGLGPAVGHQEVQHRQGPVLLAQPHIGADQPPFVGGIVLPRRAVGQAVLEVFPIEIEGSRHQFGRKIILLARRRQGDGGRGGVEIAPVGGAGDPVDVVVCGRRDDGGADVGGELIARRGVAGGGLGVAQGLGDEDGVLVAQQAPEIVPVGIGRLVRIALVADRRGQQTVQVALVWGLEGGGAGGGAQFVHIGDGLLHLGPDLAQQGLVAGVAIGLSGQEDELAVAVVLGHRIGAPRIDAARDLAVVEHIGGVPAQIVGGVLGHAQPVQPLGHHGPVADPGTVVAAGAGLQDRPLTRHQHMGQ